MHEDLTANRQPSRRLWNDPLAPATRWILKRLLGRRLKGALRVVLPSGECLRFGSAEEAAEPIVRLNTYRGMARIVRRGAIGFAEGYMNGEIDCSDLTGLFRFVLRNRDYLGASGKFVLSARLRDRIAHARRHNSRPGSRRNIPEHYDLGNAFYRLWLDPTMLYSSGYYRDGAETLEAAQDAKLQKINDLLEFQGGEKVLEIGCGWGAFALRAAEQYQVHVDGVTLSHEQLDHARKAANERGLSGSCQFRLEDYRDLEGSYDRIVSIEMIEAVGEAYWSDYFHVLSDRLAPDGAVVIQAITIDRSRFETYRRSADFIQRYVFPGGMLPTAQIIERYAAKAGLRLDYVENFGASYARTLREWRRRFEAAWPEIARQGFDEHFRRRWRYYLAYSEAGFEEGSIDVGVFRLRKDRNADRAGQDAPDS